MKLAIFGGTGPLGQEIVAQGLAAGHTLTVLARTPSKLETTHERLTVVQGDVLEPMDVQRTVEGADAVLNTLGIRKLGYNTTVSEGTRNIIRAMEDCGVSRLFTVSSVGVGSSRPQAKTMGFVFYRLLLPFPFRQSFDDKERQEAVIYQSAVDWTVVRPTKLHNRAAQGRYRVTDETDFSVSGDIARADVATFLLDAAAADAHTREIVTVSN